MNYSPSDLRVVMKFDLSPKSKDDKRMNKSYATIRIRFRYNRFLGVLLSPRAFLKSLIILLNAYEFEVVDDIDDIDSYPPTS